MNAIQKFLHNSKNAPKLLKTINEQRDPELLPHSTTQKTGKKINTYQHTSLLSGNLSVNRTLSEKKMISMCNQTNMMNIKEDVTR